MKLRVTVNNVAYDVEVDILEDSGLEAASPTPAMTAAPAPVAAPPVRPAAPVPPPPSAPAGGGKSLNSPIPGTVVEILVSAGQAVKAGERVMVIDAMKMNTPIMTTADGKVKDILVAVSEPVKMGQPLVTFE